MRTFAMCLACLLGHVLLASGTTLYVPSQYPTIQAGIDAASSGDSVLVACGTYYEHDLEMKSGVVLLGEFSTSDNPCVTIDAQRLGRVFYCENVDETAVIENFIITGGWAGAGAGIICFVSSPMVVGCIFTDNEAGSWGAGLTCYDDSSPTIKGCAFIENRAPYGGGISCWFRTTPPVKIIDCIFTRNQTEFGGSGIDCPHSSAFIANCVFSENSAAQGYGGGICCWQVSCPTLTNCSFSGNSAEFGGGLGCDTDASPALTGCDFIGNSADYGGAIECNRHCLASVLECTFVANTALRGGAVQCRVESQPRFTRCTFSGNSAHPSGGGLYCQGSSVPVLENTIIAFSTDGVAVECDYASSATLTCCDLFGNEGGDWVGTIASQFGLEGNISEDPLFCFEMNPEEPYTLQNTSPCAPYSPPNPECGLIGAWPVGCDLMDAPEPGLRARFVDLSPGTPNPFTSEVHLSIMVPGAGPMSVTLSVHDASGRLVRTLVNDNLAAGTRMVTWDGMDACGSAVPSGAYYCRLSTDAGTITRRVWLVR